MLRGEDSERGQVTAAISMRVGFVLGALWLALPQLSQLRTRFPIWLWGCLALGGLVIAVRPNLFVPVLILLGAICLLQFVGWLFKPPPGARRSR